MASGYAYACCTIHSKTAPGNPSGHSYEYKFMENGCVPAHMDPLLVEAPLQGWRIVSYDPDYRRWLLEREVQSYEHNRAALSHGVDRDD